MKKLSAIITTAVLAVGTFAAMTVSASACGKHNANAWRTPVTANSSAANTAAVNTQSKALHYFIDCNNDGICDSCSGGICMSNGLCSGYYHEHGVFIDNNNDGICDNCAAGTCTQHGIGHHNGYGNFVDVNGDGICDNCAAGVCTQHGTGLGQQQRRGCHH